MTRPGTDTIEEGASYTLPLMIGTDAQLIDVSVPINDVHEDEADGFIGVVGCDPTTSCGCVATECINGWRFMIGHVVQTHIPEPPSCKHLDLLERTSLVNLRRSNKHLHGSQSPTGTGSMPSRPAGTHLKG